MSMRPGRRIAVAAALVSLLTATLAAPSGVAAAAVSITVTTLADAIGDDGACSLREALTAATTNAAGPDASGRCPAGSSGTDTIRFAVGGTIPLDSALPTLSGSVVIDGRSAPAPVTIDGQYEHHLVDVAPAAEVELWDLSLTAGRSTGAGGAVANAGSLLLSGVTISGSHADLGGGGIASGPDSVTVVFASQVRYNGSDAAGGGIWSEGTLIVGGSTLESNAAVAGGGGIAVASMDGTVISGSTFVDNHANGPAAGGGAIDSQGVLEIANSTIYDNAAASGGGIRTAADLRLLNVTVTRNEADTGPGLEIVAGTAVVKNTIVLGNYGFGPEIAGSVAAASTHNLTALPAGVPMSHVLDSVGLMDNGGPTRTVGLAREDDNPAWGGGHATTCFSGAPGGVDQRGVARTTPCDIGASEIDDQPPVLSAPTIAIARGGVLTGSTIDGVVSWTATDLDGSGVERYVAEVDVNGVGNTTLPTDALATSIHHPLVKGSSYSFMVNAVDRDESWSGWRSSPIVTAKLTQQTASSVDFSSGWKTITDPNASGGSARWARTKGAWVRFTATGRAFALIATTGPTQGKAKVYVDGTYVETIDLRADETTFGVQAWTKRFGNAKKHVIKIVVSGTSGRPRVDVDAFAVLR